MDDSLPAGAPGNGTDPGDADPQGGQGARSVPPRTPRTPRIPSTPSTPPRERPGTPTETSYLPPPSARGYVTGVLLMAASPVSNQTGAAIGSLAFPVIGPVGVVAIRQFVTAAVLLPWVRPRLRSLRIDQWWPIIGLAVVFGVMNLTLYMAIERLGLGLAVVLEFLGPLAVAIGASRRRLDAACAVLAAVGVVVLVRPGPSTDVLGIALALVAATGWASYILLNRTLNQRLPRLHGSAAASLVTALTWVPIAAWWFVTHPPTAAALGLALACGLLASAIPYAFDPLALRRIPTGVYSTFTSVNPVIAAVVGWVLLGQAVTGLDWLGIGMIVAANVVVTSGGLRRVLRP